MKNFFLGLSLLLTSLQFKASESINPEYVKAAADVAQSCIVGCEVTRYIIRNMHLGTMLPDDTHLQKELTLSCCNTYTLSAVTCCAVGLIKPEAVIVGAGCSAVGCCLDYSAYQRLLDNHYKTGYSKLN